MTETAPPAGQTQIAAQQFWPTRLFLCDWPEQESRGPGVIAAVRAIAGGFDRPVASGVAISAKPETGLVESPLDYFDATADPDTRALAGWIEGCLRTVVASVHGNRVPADRLRVEFVNSWFHITNDGGFHDAHVHGNCSWCGIFYADPGESGTRASGAAGNGVNRFYSPIPTGGFVSDFGNSYLRRSYVDVDPVAGRLVIFPSYLLHSALPYRGASDRVILSFNSRLHVAGGAGAQGAGGGATQR